MAKVDEGRDFIAVNIAVLTVSDTRTEADDASGGVLIERLSGAGHHLAARAIVTDEQDAIAAQLRAWIADPAVDVVLATGGTGVTGRDVTPEAFHALFDKEIPGFGELFRARRLPRRLGRDSLDPARLPPPPLQLRRADASAERAQAPQGGLNPVATRR